MDFKISSNFVYFLMVLGWTVSCGQQTTDETSPEKEKSSTAILYDSIVFRTSGEQYLYLGIRLYPTNSSDPASTGLIAVESVGDTVFAFLNSELLYSLDNPKLPFATEELLRDYYPKYYDVEIDDDIPYIAYLRNSKDYVQFIKKKRGGFYVETGTIEDTVLNVFGEIKIGTSKKDVLSELGFPPDIVENEDFFLILCHADIPSKIWYKKDVEFKKAIALQKSATQLYLKFESGQLKSAYINSWIGFGNKVGIKF